jgi:hypothetical protein
MIEEEKIVYGTVSLDNSHSTFFRLVSETGERKLKGGERKRLQSERQSFGEDDQMIRQQIDGENTALANLKRMTGWLFCHKESTASRKSTIRATAADLLHQGCCQPTSIRVRSAKNHGESPRSAWAHAANTQLAQIRQQEQKWTLQKLAAQNLAKITIFGFQFLVSGTKAILLHHTDRRKVMIHCN